MNSEIYTIERPTWFNQMIVISLIVSFLALFLGLTFAVSDYNESYRDDANQPYTGESIT